MTVSRGRPAVAAQVRPLTQTFLARLFESEVTAGRTDLRQSFFWLIAMLAGPGALAIFYRHFAWTGMAMLGRNVEAYVLFDKVIYLTLTFVVVGFITAVLWPALLIDRRDGHILGALPVNLRAIVISKLAALFTYIGILSVGMHSLSAVLAGSVLGAEGGFVGVVRAVVAHVVSASALALFLFSAVAAIQATALAVVGPRQFARVSAALQTLLVLIATTALVALPALAAAAPGTLAGVGGARVPWIVYTPPVWFLGLYEEIAGSSIDVMGDLARTAGLALAGCMVVIALMYPVACRRVLAGAVQGTTTTPQPWLRRITRGLPTLLARALPTRAAVQFTLATFGRVSHQRLAITAGVGLGAAAVIPIALAWMARGSSNPSAMVAAVPLVLMVCVLTAIRVAIASPAELPARWLFAVAPAPLLAGRNAARRIMLALGAGPILAVSGLFWWLQWGPHAAASHIAVTGLAALILTEIELWGVAGIPCTRPLDPGAVNLQARWPAYLLGLLFFCVELPGLQVHLGRTTTGLAMLLGVLATVYWLVRRGSTSAARVAAVAGDPQALLLLDLSPPPVLAGSAGKVTDA